MTVKKKAAILGATGAVGQRFIQLLADHPQIEVSILCASERNAGKPYGEAVNWQVPGERPTYADHMILRPCQPDFEADIVFSALPSANAREVEPAFAAAGHAVVSNASAHRMGTDIPLLIPEINPDHTGLIEKQRQNHGWTGFIVTNPNCSTLGLALPLKALDDAFGVTEVNVVTLQAKSGAGYPGPPEELIGDNVLPHIGGEEDKIETEPNKILGTLAGDTIAPHDMVLSAQCHRVDVLDGHTEALNIRFKQTPTVDDIKQCLRDFKGLPQEVGLHTAPASPIEVRDEEDRPQPKLDLWAGKGMATVVGRIRPCPLFDTKMVILSHNTVRGAAGAAILNAELLIHQGLL
ncbi:aspartate-semialdehyde dehydrogenase [Acanthopleuribacter pedis]|uniref:aspartate-semialdehyde dehydrogenase n=1 Tax=Acanthopleuribacter pedis TaxID=442870 RepID=A0A8J7Q372_9BACT|nr:aspartate-semialdehyde dehydrogenase [Acanthopleuribacter pedis]MBO1319702.1 aspartate-semialdehyde dehydrogenase [Acanthopleuribacter pedis]